MIGCSTKGLSPKVMAILVGGFQAMYLILIWFAEMEVALGEFYS